MAKKSDITGKVLNLALIAAVVAVIYFLIMWARNNIGGNGGKLFGGSGTSPNDKRGSGSAGGNGFSAAGLQNIADKIKDSFRHEFLEPGKIMIAAFELEAANSQAKKYLNKPGTNVIINKALKSMSNLSDPDFSGAVDEFLKMNNYTDLYASPIGSAQITNSNYSPFLTRYGRITGRIGAISNSGVSAVQVKKAPVQQQYFMPAI